MDAKPRRPPSSAACRARTLGPLVLACLMATSGTCQAGGAPPPNPQAAAVAPAAPGSLAPRSKDGKSTTPATAKPSAAAASATGWSTLTPSQKAALAPLANSWAGLTEGQQRKWVAVAQNFNKLGAAERDKLHGRMADWAALSPRERERARLNFAQAKKLEPDRRTATWEAYQSLSADEKKALAAGGAPKPGGAAVTAKPVPADKLAPVTLSRPGADRKSTQAANRVPLDRNTLLPLAPPADHAKP